MFLILYYIRSIIVLFERIKNFFLCLFLIINMDESMFVLMERIFELEYFFLVLSLYMLLNFLES